MIETAEVNSFNKVENQLEVQLSTEYFKFDIIQQSHGKFVLKNRDTCFELFLCMKKWVFENLKTEDSDRIVNKQSKTDANFRLPSVRNVVNNIKNVRRPFVDRLNSKRQKVDQMMNKTDNKGLMHELNASKMYNKSNLSHAGNDLIQSRSEDINSRRIRTESPNILKKMHAPVIKVSESEVTSQRNQDRSNDFSQSTDPLVRAMIKKPQTPAIH